MADWGSAAREWGASPAAILLRHAAGEHQDNPSVACAACTAHTEHPDADHDQADERGPG